MTIQEVARLLEQKEDPLMLMVRQVKPYHIPKGYMRWENLSAIVALSLACMKANKAPSNDLASWLNVARTALWFVQDAPLYCLSNQLLRSFDESDVHESPYLFADLRPPLPTFMVLFPQNSIRTPEGTPVDYCIVHLADREHPERSRGDGYGFKVPYLEHEHDRNLHWSAIDQKETCWFSGMGLEADGTIRSSDEQVGGCAISPAEADFLRRMRSLILQCLLTLTYRPDLLDDSPAEAQPASRKGQSSRERSQASVMHPRWLGKEYKRPASTGKGNHASPKEHWRRGHWRRVVVGARELNQRKWAWIEPTFVQG